jgi:uncharacterized phage protein (predicted DNA packaging)
MEITPVITTEEVKQWCRVETDDEDSIFDTLIISAQEQAAAYTGLFLEPETCPQGIKSAIALFVADLYRNREGQTVGEKTFYRLLNPYRQGGL